MASLSKEHEKEMFEINDAASLEAMRDMQLLTETPMLCKIGLKKRSRHLIRFPKIN